MKKLLIFTFILSLSLSCAIDGRKFQQHSPNEFVSYDPDWLLTQVEQPAQLYEKKGDSLPTPACACL